MAEYPGVHLRVTPEAIPRLRAAFEDAVTMLTPALQDLGRYGYIDEAWLGDPKSAEVVAFYNARVMSAPDGPYQALVLYQEELTRIVDQLYVMEQEYQRNEEQTGNLFDGGAV